MSMLFVPIGRALRPLSLAAALTAATPAGAVVLTWQNPDPGDWFDGRNWDGGGAAPGASDTASIANGGTARASSATAQATTLLLGADVGLGPVQEGSLETSGVGVDVSGAVDVGVAQPGMSAGTGSLLVTGGSLSAGSLDIGRAAGAGATGMGTVTVTGGGATVGGVLAVGNVQTNAPGGNASGALSVENAVSGAQGDLFVGSRFGSDGSATGAVSAKSYSGDHGFVAVGRDTGGGTGGGATGSLVVDGSLDLGAGVTFLEVGFTFFDGLVADGTLTATSGDASTSIDTFIGTHQGATTGIANVRGTMSLGDGTLTNTAGSQLQLGLLGGGGRSGDAEGSLAVKGLSGYGLQRVGVGLGETGSATGTLTVGTDGIAGGNLELGRGFRSVDATGIATVAGGGATIGSLTVGEANGSGAALGSLVIDAGDLVMSGQLEVGTSSAATTASGRVSVADALSGAQGTLFIGHNTDGGGTASGSVSASSYSGDHTFVGVGRDIGGDGGSATGSLVATGSLDLGADVGFLEVGFTFFDGLVAEGTLTATSGDVTTREATFIGSHLGATTGVGDVRGTMSLGTGSLTNAAGDQLQLGLLGGGGRSGTAQGSLAVEGLSGYGLQRVGVALGDAGAATGTLTVGSGGIAGGTLQIGRSFGDADSTGTVTVTGGNVDLGGGSLDVGVSDGGGASAVGEMHVDGGDLSRGGSIGVGNVSGSDATSSARGTLSVAGGVLAAGAVRVGQATGAGTADGRLSLAGVTGSVQLLQVGEAFGAPDRNPHGRVELAGSTLGVERFVALGSGLGGGAGDAGLSLVDSRLVVGTAPTTSSLDGDLFVASSGAASAATLSLERSLIDVADDLFLGAGALLDITVDGTTRETEYGAIDAHRAVLNGALEVRFDFAPVATSLVFDLIVTELLDGIVGAFDTVSILGLDPAYTATHGVVVDTVGASQAEIYRLQIVRADVPEPGTLGLALAAIVLLAGGGRGLPRARTARPPGRGRRGD